MPDWPTRATGEEPGSKKPATSVKASVIANNVGTEPVTPWAETSFTALWEDQGRTCGQRSVVGTSSLQLEPREAPRIHRNVPSVSSLTLPQL